MLQPLRFARFTNCADSGALVARMFGPSHSSFLPVRKRQRKTHSGPLP